MHKCKFKAENVKCQGSACPMGAGVAIGRNWGVNDGQSNCRAEPRGGLIFIAAAAHKRTTV